MSTWSQPVSPVARARVLRVAAAFGVLAAACAFANLLTMALAVGFDLERLHAFDQLHDVGAGAPETWLVLSMWIDAGFYLFLAPLGVVLALVPERATRGARALHLVHTFGAATYTGLGASGALTLALVWPELLASAAAGDSGAVEAFTRVTGFVYRAVWNGAGALAGAIWWIAAGFALRAVFPRLSLLSLVLGGACALEGALMAVAPESGATGAVLDVVLTLLPLWAVCAAVALWRRARL